MSTSDSRPWATRGAWAAKGSAAARALQDDVQLELECHLELAVDDLVAEGQAPDQARAEALRRFGDIDSIAGRCLAEKRTGVFAMKGFVILIAAGLVLAVCALAFTTVQVRKQEAERALASAAYAQELAQERLRAEPLLLGAEHTAKPGDRLRLTTASGTPHDVECAAKVDLGGMVLLPEVGRVLVTDKTRAELEQWVNAAYADYYQSLPEIYVVLERDPEHDIDLGKALVVPF